MDLDGVAGAEVRDVVALDVVADLGKQVAHDLSSQMPQVSRGVGTCCSDADLVLLAGGVRFPLWQEPDADTPLDRARSCPSADEAKR
ncbi:hypothetical protein GCM10009798_23490 [Nocardioides panacihumi]|uniref:Uncharacterized protein n=1 Tax=Nocardioides panacihumi TaxID=400774 RepID=A0ABN2R3D2_9ACTN